jgi:hypothetical protein
MTTAVPTPSTSATPSHAAASGDGGNHDTLVAVIGAMGALLVVAIVALALALLARRRQAVQVAEARGEGDYLFAHLVEGTKVQV